MGIRETPLFGRITCTMFFIPKLLLLSLCIIPNFSANVDLLDATFAACDVNKDDGLTMAEVQTEGCMMTIQNLFGLSNVTEAFLMVDANKDKTITKKEGEDAATSNFDRKEEEEEETCDSCPNCEEKCSKKYSDDFFKHYCDQDGD